MFRYRRNVYLDNNATTKVSPKVRKRMDYVLKYSYGNPSSLYRTARDAKTILEESRAMVARVINAEPHEIYFTGSATEANNSILKGVCDALSPSKKKILVSRIEHPSVMSSLEYLGSKGVTVDYLPNDGEGRISLEHVEKMVDAETMLVSVMLANNEIGTIQDVAGISRIAKSRGALIMSDCVQALGKIPIDVKTLGVDYASFSAHKLHGPKGTGAIYIKEDCPFSPFIHGGHQELGLRAGTEALHNIAGFGTACQGVPDMLTEATKVERLKEILTEGIKQIKPDIIVNSPPAGCLPNTLNVAFPNINNAVFMAMLDYHGIAVSAGSACNTQDDQPSHVLKAIGLSDEQARQSLRLSLSTETTEKDIKYVLKVINDFIESKVPPIALIPPARLDENILFDERIFILDVRFWHDRKLLKGLPNSHEIPFFGFHKYVNRVPRERKILVVCQAGYNSPIVAYYLKAKGFRDVNVLMTGLVGWRFMRSDLYQKYAGQNIKSL